MEMNYIPLHIAFDSEISLDKKGNLILNDNATDFAIQSYFRDKANKNCSKDILTNAEKLSNYMIEEFKKSSCYNVKTEQERKQIIEYLKENPDEEDADFDTSTGIEIL